MSTRLCPDHNEILIDGEECDSCKAELNARPATPAPESPAPAPVEEYSIGYNKGWEDRAKMDVRPAPGSDIGTGSETSPEPAAQEIPGRMGTSNRCIHGFFYPCSYCVDAAAHPVAKAEAEQSRLVMLEALFRTAFYAGAESQGWSDGDQAGCDVHTGNACTEAWEKARAYLAQAPTRTAGERE